MKKIILIILITCIYTDFFAQKKRFVYQVTHKHNSKNNVQLFNLDIVDSSSFFYEKDFKSKNKEEIGTDLIIKKDDDVVFFYEKIYNKNAYYSIVNNLKWKILSETKKINDFTCQKAEVIYNSRKWFALFCNEIPINEGPYIFNKLPGLIIQIESENSEYKMELVEISSIDNLINIDHNDYVKYKKEEFLRLKKLKDYKSDIVKKYKNHVMTKNGKKILQEYINQSIYKNVLLGIEK